ncbi:MAG: AI-2E family transporter [Oscillospiraceae bacterium]|nr:AI-2E family transporter [Oscillospiraceae bacterium]
MKIEWKTILRLALGVIGVFLVIHYWKNIAGLGAAVCSAAFPLIIGGVIAYIISIPMGFFERHFFPKSQAKVITITRRPICMVLAYIAVLAVVALVIGLIIPQLGECVKVIVSEVPALFDRVLAYAESFHLLPENILSFLNDLDLKQGIQELLGMVTSGLGNIMSTVVNVVVGVFSGIVTSVVAIIFSIYLLLAKDTLADQGSRFLSRYLKESWYRKIVYLLSVLHDSFRRYIVGQCTEAVILGILCTLGMLLFGFPYAVMIGALVAFTALIPVAGGYIGAGVGAFMILTESPIKAVLFIVYMIILQQLEGNLIYPKVVGSSLGLPGIWVLAAVTIGGGVSGILGMLVGVPVASAVYRIIREDMHKDDPKPDDTDDSTPDEIPEEIPEQAGA